jgi:hypothetical protein
MLFVFVDLTMLLSVVDFTSGNRIIVDVRLERENIVRYR